MSEALWAMGQRKRLSQGIRRSVRIMQVSSVVLNSWRVTHAETEKEIPHAGGRYFADVYLRFESDTDLGFKWSGEVYVEILHTHAVQAEKMDDVGGLRVPMIEVPIREELLYQFPGEQTNDEREDAYRARIRRMLESPNGFLRGIVLSNPSSVEYLERELADSRQSHEVTQAQNAMLLAQGAEAASAIASAKQREAQLSGQLAAQRSAAVDLRARLDAALLEKNTKAGELANLQKRFSDQQTQANAARQVLRKTKLCLNLGGWAAATLLVGLAFLTWWRW
ncbi:MAG: hypothetical protein M3N82_01000 [Pseudomonadota bacterium]|nr:hypothetical protein [Pseudomonadota bacterium]